MRYKFLSLAFLCCFSSIALAGVRDYGSIMHAVRSRDLALLKKLVAAGYDINATVNGITPLCATVYMKDHIGYEMLLSQGAAVYVPCMRTMPSQVANEFYAQPKEGGYYQEAVAEPQITTLAQETASAPTETVVSESATAQTASSEGSSITNTVLYSGEVALGVAAVGAVALAVGGGGGGGSGGGGDDPDKPVEIVWDSPFHPTQQDVKNYESADIEYKNSNALPVINAAWAYTRGYTGYKVNRTSSGELIGKGASAITDKKVNIAILDSGFYADNVKLKTNLEESLLDKDGKINKTVNFVYGACKSGTDTNCWKEISSTASKAKNEIWIEKGDISRPVFLDSWEKYRYSTTFSEGGYTPYTYDANDPSPATSVAILQSGNEKYGYLITEGGKLTVKWGDYLYDRSSLSGSTVYDIDKLALSWTYTNSETQEQAIYYCTKGLTSCVEKVGSSTYTPISSSKLATLKSSGIFALNYDSTMEHGTSVAGLAIGKKDTDTLGFHGAAYNAAWIPMVVDLTTFEILQHIPDAINLGADIVNLSIGPGGVSTKNKSLADYLTQELNAGPAGSAWRKGYQAAAKNNTILVFAAGNDGNEYESSYYAAAPALKEFSSGTYNLQNLVVVVVSVDAQNKLSSFSQICGANKNWCVAAPGEYLLTAGSARSGVVASDVIGTGRTWITGTSAAAPIVSGALAVIKSAFPHLTNQQVVQILFETATDLGEKGVDEIYGYGLINLDAATKPIGPTTLALKNKASGAAISTASSKIAVPNVLQNVTTQLPKTMVILDKYQRAFSVPTTTFIKTVKHENQLENRFKSLMAGDEHKVVATDRFSMAWSDRHESHRASEMKHGFVDMQVQILDGLKFGAFYNENTATNGGTYLGRTLNNPFTKMKEAWGMNGSYQFSKNWRIDTMWATGKNAFVNEDDWDDMDRNRVSALQTTLAWDGLKNTTIKFVSGTTDERSSAFGLWGTGAFKSGDTRTTFMGAGATWRLSDQFQLEGMYYYGVARASKQNALVKLSDMTAESFAFNALYSPDEKHSYGLALVSPMRIRSGTATIDLPVARDAYEDLMYRSVVRADLKPSAREYDLSSYYTNQLTDAISLQSEFGVRFNPDHQAGATPDYRGLISVKIEL